MGIVKFHKSFRKLNRSKTNLRVEPVRIACSQNPAPQILQFGMLHKALHQPLANTVSAIGFEHKYVADIGDRGEIADHTGEADLRAISIINAETERMLGSSERHTSRGIPLAQ